MIVARRKEVEYFETSPDYGHLASKMGSEYLAKLLSEVCIMESFFPLVKYGIILILFDYFAALGESN
jgi:hypothetical protein